MAYGTVVAAVETVNATYMPLTDRYTSAVLAPTNQALLLAVANGAASLSSAVGLAQYLVTPLMLLNGTLNLGPNASVNLRQVLGSMQQLVDSTNGAEGVLEGERSVLTQQLTAAVLTETTARLASLPYYESLPASARANITSVINVTVALAVNETVDQVWNGPVADTLAPLAAAVDGIDPVIRSLNATIDLIGSFANLSALFAETCPAGSGGADLWHLVECPSRPVSFAACSALEVLLLAQNKTIDFDCHTLDFVNVRTRFEYTCTAATHEPNITVLGIPHHFYWRYPDPDSGLATMGNITVSVGHKCFCTDDNDLIDCSYFALNIHEEKEAQKTIQLLRDVSYILSGLTLITIGSVEYYFYHHARMMAELRDGRRMWAKLRTVGGHVLWWTVGMSRPIDLFRPRRQWKLVIPCLIAWFMWAPFPPSSPCTLDPSLSSP